jgi:alpha-ketoglutarate-dependent taurine dioxygenase
LFNPPIVDIDLSQATYDDINHIANLVAKHTLVIFKNQNLTLEQEIAVNDKFKNAGSIVDHCEDSFRKLSVPNSNGKILRVGGLPNEDGNHGISEHVDEMAWHHDFHWNLENKVCLIMLRAITGVENSKTSWLNNIMSYKDLPREDKDLLGTLKAVMKRYIYLNVDSFEEDDKGRRWATGEEYSDYECDIIRKTPLGEKHLYFPFHQIHHFKGMSVEDSRDILERISKHVTQEKYVYHHNWEIGDVTICDNRTGLHMRHQFPHISTRLLHRAMFDYPVGEMHDKL